MNNDKRFHAKMTWKTLRTAACISILLCFSCTSVASGHPGRTDSRGGHYNRKTGEYHYHNSGYSSGPSSSYGSSYQKSTTPDIVLKTNGLYYVRVIDVYSGDTIKISFSDKHETKIVRMVGCDSFSVNDKNQNRARYGKEALKFSTKHLKNKKIWLQISHDRISNSKQQIMGYVWLTKPEDDDDNAIENNLFNIHLVTNALACVSTEFPPNEKFTPFFEKCESNVKSQRSGIWQITN